MHASSAALAGNPVAVTTTTTSPVISDVGIAAFEDGDNGIDVEISIIYGIVGIALAASSALLVIYILTRIFKKRAPRRSSRSDTMSIDSWVMVYDEIPEVNLQEKAGTSSLRDVVSPPPSPTTSERTAEPAVAESGLSSFDRRTLFTIVPVFTLTPENTVDRTTSTAVVQEADGAV
ncbi:hypothetical protein MTO96_002326 [Rhipicephalus appendiculatus]